MYNLETVKNIVSNKIKESKFYNLDKSKVISLQDKLRWLNVNNCSDIKVICADKLKVKEYAANTLGIDICPKTLAIYNDANEININELPDKFMIKINNGCCKNRFVLDKNDFDLSKDVKTFNKWLDVIPGLESLEFQYSLIVPKLFAEEILISNKDESLIDYRLWCFNNKVQLISVNNGRGWGATSYFDKDFNYVNVVNSANHHSFQEKENIFNKPENFDKMKEYAEKLSTPFKFVRVDMYNINGKIYLGEMSFSPGGYCFHLNKWDGTSLDNYYGNLLDI